MAIIPKRDKHRLDTLDRGAPTQDNGTAVVLAANHGEPDDGDPPVDDHEVKLRSKGIEISDFDAWFTTKMLDEPLDMRA